MQAHASKLTKDPEAADNRFKGFDEFMASSAAAKAEPASETDNALKTEADEQPYSPSKDVMTDDDPELPDLVSLIGSSPTLAKKEVHARCLT